jgi:hypothetical protein
LATIPQKEPGKANTTFKSFGPRYREVFDDLPQKFDTARKECEQAIELLSTHHAAELKMIEDKQATLKAAAEEYKGKHATEPETV